MAKGAIRSRTLWKKIPAIEKPANLAARKRWTAKKRAANRSVVIKSDGNVDHTAQSSRAGDTMTQLKRWAVSRTKGGAKAKLTNDKQLVYQFPLLLCFFRGDRGGMGEKLATEAMKSLDYWDLDSDHFLDMVFLGWEDGPQGSAPIFDAKDFLAAKKYIEKQSKWKYSGESDILMLNYIYDGTDVALDFSETITLRVEDMLRNKTVSSLDKLIHDLIEAAKSTPNPTVWKISDKIGIQLGRKALWDTIISTFLGKLGKVYQSFRPFAVCNLSR